MTTTRTSQAILSISITERGRQNAYRLPYQHFHCKISEAVRREWNQFDGFVLFCSVGIAVRLIGPLLGTKATDPTVVVVDEMARFVVPICGGHRGGNNLARDVAATLKAEPVVTTATDAVGITPLDTLPGFAPSGDIASVTRKIVDGYRPSVIPTLAWPLPEWNPNGVLTEDSCIVVTDQRVPAIPDQVVLNPPSLVVGVGASSDAPAGEAEDLMRRVLSQAGLSEKSVARVATIDRRANDPVITSFDLPITSFTAQQLAQVSVPNPSEVVLAEVGTSSVAEAAALLAAGPGAELICEKAKASSATVAVARRARPEGKVSVIGLGPGAADMRTPQAVAAVRSADVVIGYSYYVDQIEDLHASHHEVVRSPIGAEVDRCTEAVKRAAEGQNVALVCSGDPGVFAMATLVLELAPEHGNPAVHVVSGVTASLASSAIVGAPLAHDHAMISLSDLLTPWETIRERVTAVASSDMAVAFYNPRSQRRTTQLVEAMQILAEHRPGETPVAVIVNATREGERVHVTTIADFDSSVVDMFSLVIVGSSTSYIVNGKIVTPRGYDR